MRKAVTWTPRILGILFVLFTSLFAFDVFEGPATIWEQILGFLIHLIPVYVLIAGIWLGWRRPLLGAIVFLGFSGWYIGTFILSFEGQGMLAPNLFGLLPAVLGLLFLLDWWLRRKPETSG